jgi:hypothetical protein
MARMNGLINARGHQIVRARELMRINSVWSAAAYLRNRHWHLDDTLYILLRIKSQRLLRATEIK